MLTIYLYRCSLQHKKAEMWEASCIATYIYGQICSAWFDLLCVCSQIAVKYMGNGIYMLIFQPYLPHIIMNSWRPLHDLSHSSIIGIQN